MVIQAQHVNWKSWITGLILLAVFTAVPLSLQAQEQGVEELADTEISNAVDDELLLDAAVPARMIGVDTEDGIVTLSGTVDNILAKHRAEKIASTVKGVRGIVNQLEVDAPFRSDAEIQEDVQNALLSNAATESWEIVTLVNDRTVTLKGVVDSWQERQLAGKIAKGVWGVTGLDNNLTVDYTTDRHDADIKSEVRKALRWDVYIDDGMIDVEVDDGKVTLTGTVGSMSEKIRAANQAWVAGVKSVDNSDLEVSTWARDENLRENKYVDVSDEAVRSAVRDALHYDPRVSASDIAVSVDKGYVTLRGAVDTLSAKRAARADTRNVVGAWGVKNQLKVRAEDQPRDARIEDTVEASLSRDPYVERYDVTVSVTNGVVSLYGEVDTAYEKAQAEDVAARQIGVVDVNNFLTVRERGPLAYEPYTEEWYEGDYDWYTPPQSYPRKEDWRLKQDVEDQLYWSSYVDEDEINIKVEDGTVTLTGDADTLAERRAATENAYQAGAVEVRNHLDVQYGPEYYQP